MVIFFQIQGADANNFNSFNVFGLKKVGKKYANRGL